MNRLTKLFSLLIMYFSSSTVLAETAFGEAGFFEKMANKFACVVADNFKSGELINDLRREPQQSKAIIYKSLPPSLSDNQKEINFGFYAAELSNIVDPNVKNVKCLGIAFLDKKDIVMVVYSFVKSNETLYATIPYYSKGINKGYLLNLSSFGDSLIYGIESKAAIRFVLDNF